jgi:pimeloyl-ACP methyl ester carboxylesterase
VRTYRQGIVVTRKGRIMAASTTRMFTPARIVALALIAVLVGGLTYLRFAPEPEPVSVPAGAEAGDLILEPCEYATESGTYAADCGTLVVPENRADPQSRLIALPVTRIRARSDHPAEPIFALWGGPGLTNMEWSQASRYADDHDVVLIGYRGVDGSVRLDCPEVESALAHSTDFLAEESFRAYGDALRSCADRLTDEGVDLAGYSLAQQVDDMEAARVALGYDRINLLSESAGTRTAMIYAWRHPESIHRSVNRRADRPLRRPLFQRRRLQPAHRRPRRLDAADGPRDSRALVLPADQGGQRARHRLPRTVRDDVGGGRVWPGDHRLVAFGG